MRWPWRLFLISALALVPLAAIPSQASQRPGTLVGIDGTDGHRLFRVETPGPGSLAARFWSDGVVVAERRDCFDLDQADPDSSAVLVGYDARTGKQRWTQPPGRVIAGLSPEVAMALTPGVLPLRDTASGELTGIDPRTGATLWSLQPGLAAIRASTSEILVVGRPGADRDRLEGIDRDTGRNRWSYEIPTGRHTLLVAAGGDVVAAVVVVPTATIEEAAGAGAWIDILSASSGRLEHEIPLDLTIPQKLALDSVEVFDGSVVVDVGELVAFDAGTGAQAWRSPGHLDSVLPAHIGSARADIALIRTGAGTGSPVSITALDAVSGRRRWRRDLGPFIYGAAATRSTLVVFERDGYQALDPTNGRERWHVESPKGTEGMPGMAGRDLYLSGGCPLTSAD